MQRNRRAVRFAAVATRLLGTAAACAALAGASSAVAANTTAFEVRAFVPPTAVISLEQKAQSLEIGEADLRRGYFEVVMRSRLRMTSRPRQPDPAPQFVLDFEPGAQAFAGLGLVSSSGPASPAGGHDIDAADQVREFRYRVELASDFQPGRASAPLTLTIEL